MRRLLASLSLALPLVAGAQVLPGPTGAPAPLPYESLRAPGQGSGLLMPLWRSADGRMLALATHAGSAPAADPTRAPSSLDFNVVDASQLMRSTLSYDVAARLSMHVSLGQRLWPMTSAHLGDGSSCTPGANIGCLNGTLSSPLRMINGEVGATYHGSHYTVGVAVNQSKPIAPLAPAMLPRVVPNAPVTSSGLSFSSLGSSTDFSAHGRLALGHQSGLDLGASVGRIRLLPGNVLGGVGELGSKSLSLGVDSGGISGNIVGHMVQPETGAASNLLGPDRRWTSIDLGVTVRLPWQGQLSFGAQNVWSSGQTPAPVNGPDPDQSRMPYVQYHQDL
ncbi:hypothetical protein [Oleiagrimonas sp. C23AA]|uniref:hypothetical protein n=1 Tax=Oleiagrimonas sp. C23AA TaxID=2719047 RepID=UPI00142201AA|nr:hypothetical protein [Oleiagrimonas sp. C23AA]NII12112.1 hypothetical protein [Oleiagrimonas sp. C23AA]